MDCFSNDNDMLNQKRKGITFFIGMFPGSPCSRDGTSWKDASKGKVISVLMSSPIHKIILIQISHLCLCEKIAIGGARSKDYFDRHGDLKRIRRLKFWPLDRLLVEKYEFSESDAREFAEFLCPLLDFSPEKRPTAQQCLQHPWLNLRSSGQNEMQGRSNVDVGMRNLQI